MKKTTRKPTVLELCAGGGGQALGLEMAGFECAAAVEIETRFCETLKLNRPSWNVISADLNTFDASPFMGVSLVAGGVPCPPFSIAGKQLGVNDSRDLFPAALRVIKRVQPKAVLLENVPGFASRKFEGYRRALFQKLKRMGYESDFRILNASDFGVPQLRPRFILVAMRPEYFRHFVWPTGAKERVRVGEALVDLMAAGGWPHAKTWASDAMEIAPTLVGGSTKHGGPDLGPSRARQGWLNLGVNGRSIADSPPGKHEGRSLVPRLTVRMAARIQGFPDQWEFVGKKTIAYRQIGNAFPPPVAKAVGSAILLALKSVK